MGRPCLPALLAAVLVGLLTLEAGAGTASGEAFQASMESGNRAYRDRDYSRAVAQFERASELRPESEEAWTKLGLARSRLQDWEGAAAAYGKTIELDPEDPRAHHNLGNVHYRAGDYEAAVVAYGRAIELDPTYLLAAFHYGWTLRQLGRSEEAEKAFELCLGIPADGDREASTHLDCTFGLGSVRHRAGDYESSAQLMEQVLRAQPQHPEARYYLAMAYRQLGRAEDAARELEIHRRLLETRRKQKPIEKPDS